MFTSNYDSPDLPSYALPNPAPFSTQETKTDNTPGYSSYPKMRIHERKYLEECIANALTDKYSEYAALPLLFDDRFMPLSEMYIRVTMLKEKEQTESDSAITDPIARAKSVEDDDQEDVNQQIQEPLELSVIFPERLPDTYHAVLQGAPGIGKTTLSQLISYSRITQENADAIVEIKEWADQFNAVITIPLRKLKTFNPELESGACFTRARVQMGEFILKEVLGLENDQRLGETLLQRVERLLECMFHQGSPYLLVLDGFDELPTGIYQQSSIKNHEILKQLIQYPYWLLSSRPNQVDSKIIELVKKDVAKAQGSMLELMGFTDEDVHLYIDNFFKVNEEMAQGLKQFINDHQSLHEITHIPICLELLCFVWEDRREILEQLDDVTATELYYHIITFLASRGLRKHEISVDNLSANEILDRYHTTLQLLQKISLSKRKEDEILVQAQDVHDTLELIDMSEFDIPEYLYDECVPRGASIKDRHKQRATNILLYDLSLLTLSKDQAARLDKDSYFVHLSFQEFLAACELMRQLASEEDDISQQAMQWIAENKYVYHYRNTMCFLAGLTVNEHCHLVWQGNEDQRERALSKLWSAMRTQVDLLGEVHIQLLTDMQFHMGERFHLIPDCGREMDGESVASEYQALDAYYTKILESCPLGDLEIAGNAGIRNCKKWLQHLSADVFKRAYPRFWEAISQRVKSNAEPVLISCFGRFLGMPKMLIESARLNEKYISDEPQIMAARSMGKFIGRKMIPEVTPELLDYIARWLKSSSISTRKVTCWLVCGLGTIVTRSPDLVQQLSTLLIDEVEEVRLSALEAIKSLPVKSMITLDNCKLLGSMLGDKNKKVRSFVDWVARNWKDAIVNLEFISELALCLVSEDQNIQAASQRVVNSLSEFLGYPVFAESIIKLANQSTEVALGIIVKYQDNILTYAFCNRLIKLLQDVSQQKREFAKTIIIEVQEKIITPLFSKKLLLVLRHENPLVRASVVETVIALDKRILTVEFQTTLLELFQDIRGYVRTAAFDIFSALTEDVVSPIFIDELNILKGHENSEISEFASQMYAMLEEISELSMEDFEEAIDAFKSLSPLDAGADQLLAKYGHSVIKSDYLGRLLALVVEEITNDDELNEDEDRKSSYSDKISVENSEEGSEMSSAEDLDADSESLSDNKSSGLLRSHRAIMDYFLSLGPLALIPDFVNKLLEMLASDIAEVRNFAFLFLKKSGVCIVTPQLVDGLIRLVCSNNADITILGSQLLQQYSLAIATPEFYRMVYSRLSSDDLEQIGSGLLALNETYPGAPTKEFCAKFSSLLQNDNPMLRKYAARALWEVDLQWYLDEIIDQLKKLMLDENVRVRRCAIAAISRNHKYLSIDDRFVEDLTGCLKDDDDIVKLNALRLVGRCGSVLNTSEVAQQLLESINLPDSNVITWELAYRFGLMYNKAQWREAAKCFNQHKGFYRSIVGCEFIGELSEHFSQAQLQEMLSDKMLAALEKNLEAPTGLASYRQAARDAVAKLGRAAAKPGIIIRLRALLRKPLQDNDETRKAIAALKLRPGDVVDDDSDFSIESEYEEDELSSEENDEESIVSMGDKLTTYFTEFTEFNAQEFLSLWLMAESAEKVTLLFKLKDKFWHQIEGKGAFVEALFAELQQAEIENRGAIAELIFEVSQLMSERTLISVFFDNVLILLNHEDFSIKCHGADILVKSFKSENIDQLDYDQKEKAHELFLRSLEVWNELLAIERERGRYVYRIRNLVRQYGFSIIMGIGDVAHKEHICLYDLLLIAMEKTKNLLVSCKSEDEIHCTDLTSGQKAIFTVENGLDFSDFIRRFEIYMNRKGVVSNPIQRLYYGDTITLSSNRSGSSSIMFSSPQRMFHGARRTQRRQAPAARSESGSSDGPWARGVKVEQDLVSRADISSSSSECDDVREPHRAYVSSDAYKPTSDYRLDRSLYNNDPQDNSSANISSGVYVPPHLRNMHAHHSRSRVYGSDRGSPIWQGADQKQESQANQPGSWRKR